MVPTQVEVKIDALSSFKYFTTTIIFHNQKMNASFNPLMSGGNKKVTHKGPAESCRFV